MRAFVAIEVSSPEVLDALAAFQRDIEGTGADLKVVERENLHFTVKFLGEVSEDEAKRAGESIGGLRLPRGEVEVQGAGAFPSPARPSVVWAGVKEADRPLVSAVALPVIEALKGIGQDDDRPFRPHITLARVRSRSPHPRLLSLLRDSSQRPFGRTALASVKLKSSRLTPSGPVYTDIGAFPLL